MYSGEKLNSITHLVGAALALVFAPGTWHHISRPSPKAEATP